MNHSTESLERLQRRYTDRHPGPIHSARDLLEQLGWTSNASSLISTIGVCGSEPGVGATSTTLALAQAASSATEQRVLVVDANQRNPKLHRLVRASGLPGMSAVLCGKSSLEDAIIQGRVGGPDLLPFGRSTQIARGLTQWPDFLADVMSHYHLILFDVPASDRPSPLHELLASLDATLLVVSGKSRRASVRKAKQVLRRSGAMLSGAVYSED